ncbi:MAG: glycosyltransferase family 4 protein [Ignavibacteriae bacterium]|nr:glycosyltransferase family 4 protein [Ignavibacteriota bacterium]
MNIGFLSSGDTQSKQAWSGSSYYIGKQLEKNCGKVIHLGPMKGNPMFWGKVGNKILQKLASRHFNFVHNFSLARKFAKFFQPKIDSGNFDVIVAVASSTELSLIETKIPIVSINDITSYLAQEYYPEYSRLTVNSRRVHHKIEQMSLAKSRLLLYSSEWAANSARTHYKLPKTRIECVPFGANIDDEDIPNRSVIQTKNQSDTCNLLFVGVDWERKGGQIAFETLLALLKRSINTTLTVCGCIPPQQFRHKNLNIIPFLNKNSPTEKKMFAELFLDSSFFILPTRQDAYGIVFCEAGAYGVPSITTNTGGVTEIVHNGINGYALDPSANAEEYADVIERIWTNTDEYKQLVLQTRQQFEEKYNWDAWGRKAGRLIGEIL